MRRRTLLGTLAMAATAAVPGLPAIGKTVLPNVQVYKNPSCGCCGAWVDHLRSAGFTVAVTEIDDTAPERKRRGLPERYAGCHTAVVSGYVIEGHVPADDVKRLLATEPLAIGLAVPGMPVGSPGMEMGQRKDPFKVLLVDSAGRETVFSTYPK